MNTQKPLINENNFCWGTGLNPDALRKFEEFGFVTPIFSTSAGNLYSEEDLDLVLRMRKFVGEFSLRDAYEKAWKQMNFRAAHAA